MKAAFAISSVTLIAVLTGVITGCSPGTDSPGQLPLVLEESFLCAVPDPKYIALTITANSTEADGQNVAYLVRTTRGVSLITSDNAEHQYSAIDAFNVTFSPDGKRLAYIGKRNGAWVIVINGQELPDNGSIAILREVVGGKSQEAQTFLAPVKFSRDLRHVAHLSAETTKSEAYVFLENGTSYYAAGNALATAVMLDGKQVGSTRLPVDFFRFAFSENGERTAFVAKVVGGKEVAIIDGQSSDSYDHVYDIWLSSRGSNYCFTAKSNNSYAVVLNGRLGKYYHAAESITPSSDRSRVAYKAKVGGKWIAVADDREFADYADPNGFQFSSNGQSFAFSAKLGNKQVVVVDGIHGPEFDSVSDPVFFDGIHVAYSAKLGSKQLLIVNGQEQTVKYSIERPAFSSDGRHFAHASGNTVIIDDQRGPRFDEILVGPSIYADNTVRFIAKKGKNLVKVKHALKMN